MALAHAGADPNAIVAGVRAVRDQALDVLSGLGYPRQDDVGVPFDPPRHEVVAVVSPEEAGSRARWPPCCGRATANPNGSCDPRPSPWPTGRGEPWRATTTTCSGSVATPAPEEIQPAYRRQARAYHPDVNRDPAAEDRFKEVAEAYDVLSDPKTRRALRPLRRRLPAGSGGLERPGAPRGAVGARAGRARARLPGRRVLRLPTAASATSAAGPASTSRTCWAGSSAAAGRGGPMPGADQEADSRSRSRRPTAAADGDHAAGHRRPAQLHGHDPAGRRRRPAHPAGRRGRPRPGRRPGRATSTWSCGSARTSATGWRAATSTSSCRLSPVGGRPRRDGRR